MAAIVTFSRFCPFFFASTSLTNERSLMIWSSSFKFVKSGIGLHLFLILVAFSGAAQALAGEITLIDGVPHVMNGAEPASGRHRVQLEEVWRIGGEDDDVFFGLIGKVCSDEQGNIYILDSQMCQVHVYSPDGHSLGILFREGEGPGEVSRPRSVAVLGDGTVGVIQEFPGRMVRVDRDNNPAPEVNLFQSEAAGNIALDGCYAGGPTLVFSGTRIHQAVNNVQKRSTFLAIYSLDGSEQAILVENPSQRDYNNLVFAEKNEMPSYYWANCVGPDGRVYTAPRRDQYAIEVYSPSGTLDRVIKREYQHCRRSPAEKKRLYDSLDSLLRALPMPYSIVIEDYDYDIMALQGGVRVRSDGTLWVLPSRGVHDQADGVMLTFDVFDPDGHFQKQVSMQCDHDGLWDGFFFAGEDRAVVVTRQVEAIAAQYGDGASVLPEEEGSAMEVICYRMSDPR